MKLLEATQRSAQARSVDGPPFHVRLATGFTPLSLETFLEAHLGALVPDKKIVVEKGEYGDLAGTLRAPVEGGLMGVLCFIEWADLDPRLSARSTARHTLATLDQIVEDAERRATVLADALLALKGVKVVVSTPTLELPPIFPSTSRTLSSWEARLHAVRASLAARLAGRGVEVLSGTPADPSHFSLRSELEFDFPYSVRHADALAGAMAQVLVPPPRRKGIILDLDNTFWSGIVGDDGVANVSWELAARTQHYAYFQRLVNILAESGILVGIASKNEASVAEEALGRKDLLVERRHIFPVFANWGSKSESVKAIAKTWNVAESSLVFVDDSALEREEVERANLGIATVPFPANDVDKIPQLMQVLRDYFGAAIITDEDKLRVSSIRSSAELSEKIESNGELTDDVLAGLGAALTISFKTLEQSQRALQLTNKTNQFNLNGRRWELGELTSFLGQGGALVSVEYEDRYGRLGEISSLLVRHEGGTLTIASWVLSCRAFARRIEYATLRTLLEHYTPDQVCFDLESTPRNGPSRNTISALAGTEWSWPAVNVPATLCIASSDLLARLPKVFADVTMSG